MRPMTESRTALLRKRILTTVAIPGGILPYDGERTFASLTEAGAAHPEGIISTGRSHEEYRPTLAFRDETEGSGLAYRIAVYGWRTDAPWDGKTTYVPRLICEFVPDSDGVSPKMVSGDNAPGFFLGEWHQEGKWYNSEAPKDSSPIHLAVGKWAVRFANADGYAPLVCLGRELPDLAAGKGGYIGDAIASHLAPKGALLWTTGDLTSFRNEDGTAMGVALQGLPLGKRCAANLHYIKAADSEPVEFPDFGWLEPLVLGLVKPGEIVPKTVLAVQGGKTYRLEFWATKSSDGSSEVFMTLRERLKAPSLARERSEAWGFRNLGSQPFERSKSASQVADREPGWFPIQGRDAAHLAFVEPATDLRADLYAVDGKTVGREEAIRAMGALPKSSGPEDEALFAEVVGGALSARTLKALRTVMKTPFLRVMAIEGYFEQASEYVAEKERHPASCKPGEIAQCAWSNYWRRLSETFNPDGKTTGEILGLPDPVWRALKDVSLDKTAGFYRDPVGALALWGLTPDSPADALRCALRLSFGASLTPQETWVGKGDLLPAGKEAEWLPRLAALVDACERLGDKWECTSYIDSLMAVWGDMSEAERARFPLWFDPEARGRGTNELMASYLRRSLTNWIWNEPHDAAKA